MSLMHRMILRLLSNPARVVVIDEQRQWRAFELLVGAFHLANEIERTSQSKVVGIMLPTSGLFPMATLASWMLGRAVVPINYLMKPEDIQHVCDDSGVDTIITVSPMLDFLKEIPVGPRYIRLDELDFKKVPIPRWPKPNSAEDLGVLLYTSGTSGRPKGVILTHGNLTSNVDQIKRWVDFDSQDSMLGVLPQFHVFGMTVLTFLPLTVGMRIHYLAKFNPRKIVQWMAKYRPSVFIAIPSMYNALLTVRKAKADDFKSLRYLVSGGEPLPEEVAQKYRERFNVRINEGYGLTETSAVSHWCRPAEYRPRSVGRSIPEVEVRIVSTDNDERVLAVGEDGEIRMRGPNIMQGYYNLPDETAQTFDTDGFFRTGDIGHQDEDGFLYITGRLKEMMIIAGENVFPRDIEEVLNRDAAVYESAVIGVDDGSRGEIPIAFVEIAEGEKFDEQALKTHCQAGLPRYKVPREVHQIEALPRNATGKILRRMLVDPNPDR